jgi:UDP-N-acetylglucosamine--N-acetylmuramyl-(pentapeptide) pyrophosphoryl-undecaprenol N-acetylglucosamine transferase
MVPTKSCSLLIPLSGVQENRNITIMEKTIILSSGGTGGHVFPALSLAEELQARGYKIVVMTDQRGQAFQQAQGVSQVVTLPVQHVRGLLRALRMVTGLVASFFCAMKHMLKARPLAVVGFGGYASVPAVLAAQVLRIPTLLHEQNAVLGRANRMVALLAQCIAISYEKLKLKKKYLKKVFYTGTPVRPSIAAVRSVSYTSPAPRGEFCLLITGGSQGARIFSDIIPCALLLLPDSFQRRLLVWHQCRAEYLDGTTRLYSQSRIKAEVASFFHDMDQKLAAAHLVIARSGSSTVAELTVTGRPAVLVPYAHAMDNHQQANADSLAKTGGAWVVSEPDFTPEKLGHIILQIMTDADQNGHLLKAMAENMYRMGQPQATRRLADSIEGLIN